MQEISISSQIPISGTKRPYYGGVYFDDTRWPAGNVNVPGIGRPYDGATTIEPSVLGGVGIRNFIPHATVVNSAALIITVSVKKYDNGWHNAFKHAGWPAFHLVDVSSITIDGNQVVQSIPTHYGGVGSTVLMIPPQLRAFFYEAEAKRLEKYNAESERQFMHDDVSQQWNFHKPMHGIAQMAEVEWSDPLGTHVTYSDEEERLKKVEVVKKAYRDHPQIGFCNGEYIRKHVLPAGVIDCSIDQGHVGRMDVGLAVCGGVHTMNFWGPFVENLDRLGFYIGKTKPQEKSPAKLNPFDIRAWRNPSTYAPGIPIGDSGRRVTSRRSYEWPSYLAHNGDVASVISYNFGFVNRRDPLDQLGRSVHNNWLHLGGNWKELSVMHSEELLGIKGEPSDAPVDVRGAVASSEHAERPIYLHVSMQ